MQRQTIGSTPICKGQLLSLYIDKEDDSYHQTVVLYALKDFDISEVMASYYQNCENKRKLLKSEVVLPEFVDHLIAEGYAYKPDAEIVRLGGVGRPPARMIEEYKYKQNPSLFMLETVKKVVYSRCNGVFGARGKHFNLMNPEYCNFSVRAAVSVNDIHLGMMEVGITPSKNSYPIDEDMEGIQNYLQTLIDTELPNQGIVITAVFPPSKEEIAIERMVNKKCRVPS